MQETMSKFAASSLLQARTNTHSLHSPIDQPSSTILPLPAMATAIYILSSSRLLGHLRFAEREPTQ